MRIVSYTKRWKHSQCLGGCESIYTNLQLWSHKLHSRWSFLWNAASADVDGVTHTERQEPLVVIDIGGMTSDSGLSLPNGLPKMSSMMSLVRGVRINFALHALESIGLGSGRVIRASEPNIAVGLDSIALDLTKKARLFGGDVLTATDIVAAMELHSLSKENPLKGLGDPACNRGIESQTGNARIIGEVIDRAKVQEGVINILIVRGRAMLIDTNKPLPGVLAVRKFSGDEVANAVGVTISRVSQVLDTVVDTTNQTLKDGQAKVPEEAIEAVVRKRAQRDTVQIAEVTVLSIQYVDAKHG